MAVTGCDAIVVGLGAMGSAAAYHLARRGVRVLGLDVHAPGHMLGSSHGESRIIRMAYKEHPDYVPLLRRAYQLWADLEEESGEPLLRITGGLFLGPLESGVVAGSLESARAHGLPHELLDSDEIRRHYPAFAPADGHVALYETAAGILYPERCIAAHLQGAARVGAELRHEEGVLGWEATDAGVEVTTTQGRYVADRLVLAAGAWLGGLLSSLRLPLQPERSPIFHLQPRRPELFEPDRLPIYVWEVDGGRMYYGLPHLKQPGAKVGRHHTGEACDPDTVNRDVTATDEADVRGFVSRYMPALNGPIASGIVCLYTNTPDEHFIVDRHPEQPHVVYASACSGHGFKFSAVIGEVLADLATDRPPNPSAAFLRAERLEYRGARSL